MNVEKLKEIVSNSELPQIQKNVMIGFMERADQEQTRKVEERLLIEQVANEKHLSQVVLSTDEVKIYTVNPVRNDDWAIKFPFRSIYLSKKGTWSQCNTVAPTLDLAFLVYLENKHLGQNSRFSDFAMKMLEIPMD